MPFKSIELDCTYINNNTLIIIVFAQLAIDIVRKGLLANHNVMPGYHICDELPNNNKKHKCLKIFKK